MTIAFIRNTTSPIELELDRHFGNICQWYGILRNNRRLYLVRAQLETTYETDTSV